MKTRDKRDRKRDASSDWRARQAMPMLEPLEPRLLLAATPILDAGVHIESGRSPIDVNATSAPAVIDWNNDGRKDLLIGQFTQGKMWVYLNSGTDRDPLFGGGTLLRSGGGDITTSYG